VLIGWLIKKGYEIKLSTNLGYKFAEPLKECVWIAEMILTVSFGNENGSKRVPPPP
jgi:hypothetical protein